MEHSQLFHTYSPGKCLINGGYLILSPKNQGIVFNLDSYIHCASSLINFNNTLKKIFIDIYSAYENKNYSCALHLHNGEIKIEGNINENKWIKFSVASAFFSYFLSFPSELDNAFTLLTKKKLSLTILSDFRFYGYSTDSANNKQIKTGLGSSSALTTSIVSNLMLTLHHMLQENHSAPAKNVREIKNDNLKYGIILASLIANNLSQNKIGSSFDILSCLMGSQIFHKFEKVYKAEYPLVINEEVKNEFLSYISYLKSEYIPSLTFLENYPNISNLLVSLISVECGSDTRVFVKNVTEYAKKKMTKEIFDDELFSELNKVNNDLIAEFLTKEKALNLPKLKELSQEYRLVVQKISEASCVEIEPKALRPLLDSLKNEENILYAICPGAGGYDSVAVLGYGATSKEGFNETIEKCIKKFNESSEGKFIAHLIEANLNLEGTRVCAE